MKQVLTTTIEQLEPKVEDDEKASSELTKLKDASGRELDRMARQIKATFRIEKLDPAGLKKVEAEIKETIQKADSNDLKRALRNRDPNIVAPMCWLWGCP